MQEEVELKRDEPFIQLYTWPLAAGSFSFITLTESLNKGSPEDGDAKGGWLMPQKKEVRNLSCLSLCLSHSTVMASLSVIKGTFESDEPIKGAFIFSLPRCLFPPSLALSPFSQGSEKNFWQIGWWAADSPSWHLYHAWETLCKALLFPVVCGFTDTSISLLVAAIIIYLHRVLIPTTPALVCWWMFNYFPI